MTEDTTSQKKTSSRNGDQRIELTTPWGAQNHQSMCNARASVPMVNGAPADQMSDETAAHFVETRTRAHELYITEMHRNQRLGMLLSFFLILFAITIMVFAPSGRETLSYWIGAALLLFSAGALGYGESLPRFRSEPIKINVRWNRQ